MADLVLTPLAATLIFVAAVIAGVNFRRVWKSEGPRWQLWVFGVVAGVSLCAVGFLPLDVR